MNDEPISLYRPWDIVVACVATAAALYAPYELVLGLQSRTALLAAESLITVIFLIDLWVRYRRKDLPAVPVPADPSSSNRSWVVGLVFDAVAALPFFLLLGPTPLILLRALKLFRVAAMMRLLRGFVLTRAGILRLVFFLYWLSLSSHWIACGWIALLHVVTGPEGWPRYLSGLYWTVTTLTTVGYGDITPVTDGQKVYTMGVMILGVGMYGFVIGNIASILANIDPVRASYLQRMEQVTAFMHYRKLPDPLQHRISEYFRYLWHQRLDHDESEILDRLPPSLGTEVALHLKKDLLEVVPMFKGASASFIREIALGMRQVVYLPGDYIVHAGYRGRGMYFITHGKVEVVSPDEKTTIATLEEGDFFGEMALVFDQPRSASVRALDYCDLYHLDQDLFKRVLSNHPEIASEIEARARERREAT